MTSPERVYAGSVRILSVVMLGLGVVILVRTFAAGGGSVGILLGIAFIGVGAGRLWLASRMNG